MKFKHNIQTEVRECVAYTFHMTDEPSRVGLVVKTLGGRGVWMYYDGQVAVGDWEPEIALTKFHEGDTIEITF